MSEWKKVLEELKGSGTKLPPGSMEYGIYPGGFDKALVAVRKEIRAARKAKEPHEDKLRQLYGLAAIEAWLFDRREKHAPVNISRHFPKNVLERLDFDYMEFGYEHLGALKVTDKKWLVAAFGEPEQHRKPSEIYEDVYAVGRAIEDRDKAQRERPWYESLDPEIREKVEPVVKRNQARARAEFEQSEAERDRARKERQEAIRRRKEREANGGIDPQLTETARKAREGGCLSMLVVVALAIIVWL